MDQPPDIRLFRAKGVLDAVGVSCAPGALLIETVGGRSSVLAAGQPAEVESHPAAAAATVVERTDSILIPGLVNAHTHLDLTHIGPQPYDPVRGRFGDWLAMILRERATDEQAVRDSVRLGVERSLQGGVVAVGDIAGVWSIEPTRVLRGSPQIGTSYIEAFGIGPRQDAAAANLETILLGIEAEANGIRAGLTPHAPYTVGLDLYEQSLALSQRTGAPWTTHLAESEPEHEFIGSGGGLFKQLLESMGLWDASILDEIAVGKTPAAHFFDRLQEQVVAAAESAPILMVHCNDISDDDLETLAGAPVSVAYCPRSSTYFGAHHRFGPHRYAEMLDRGINVALGTDSIVNLPESAAGQAPAISTLDEIRFLHQRDGIVPAERLLQMATTNGARAIGVDPSLFTFSPGPVAGVLAVGVGSAQGSLADAIAQSAGDPELLTLQHAVDSR